MSTKMIYKDKNDFSNRIIEFEVNDDANLTELFSCFVELTRMAGYYSTSWANVITEVYNHCVVHSDASNEYDIYQWASDVPFEDI